MDPHDLIFPRGDEILLEGIIKPLLKISMSKSKTLTLSFRYLNLSLTVSLMILKSLFDCS